jgi:hypothetical protein
MDSAPRDGTRILLFWPHIGHWVTGYMGSRGHAGGRWMGYFSPSNAPLHPVSEPTAWLPMPPPPTDDEDDRRAEAWDRNREAMFEAWERKQHALAAQENTDAK